MKPTHCVLGIVALAAASCGSSGGDSSSAAPVPGGKNASAPVDIAFEDYHFHGGQQTPLITVHIRIANHSPNNMEPGTTKWQMRDDTGATVMSGEVPALPSGAQIDVEQDFHGNSPGRHAWFFVLDPDNEYTETSESNNTAEIITDAPASAAWPIGSHEVRWKDPHAHLPTRVTLILHATILNLGTSGETVTDIPWRIRREDGTVINSGTIAALAPGDAAAEANETVFTITETPGEHTYSWEIDPDDTLADDGRADDTLHYTVVIPADGSG
jgi:hypothetical protein